VRKVVVSTLPPEKIGQKLYPLCLLCTHAINSCHVFILTNPTAHGDGEKATAWEATVGACGVFEELF
jgi:hypothetical protein